MPPRKLIVLLLLSCCAGVAAAKLAAMVGGKGHADVEEKAEAVVSAAAVAPSLLPGVPVKEVKTPDNPAYPDQQVWATGLLRRGKHVVVVMSDGTRVTEEHPDLQGIWWRSYVKIAGRLVPLKAAARADAQASKSQSDAKEQEDNGKDVPSPSGESEYEREQKRQSAEVMRISGFR